MTAIITVGLGFGDEGKGAVVDFLSRELEADLVVRYSGGAQAGHNVELPDGRRHTFAQFGAGTLAGASTHLGPRMIVCPATLIPEAEHLVQMDVSSPMSRLTADPRCLIATQYHATMNRLRELARGTNRHGSCGLGIGECRHYWLRYGSDAIFARDLHDSDALLEKLTLMHDRFLLDMQELDYVDDELAVALYQMLPMMERDGLESYSAELRVASCPEFNSVIFEGSQGVLLDEWFGFHPHTTWSTVTTRHAFELAAEMGLAQTGRDRPKVLGITRAITTRHGAGPMPTECSKLNARFRDRGNPPNDWQGKMRAGSLDLSLLEYAMAACPVDGLAVTCLDQYPGSASTHYSNMGPLTLPVTLKEQMDLAEQLKRARPVVEEMSIDQFLEELDRLAPIAIQANGPNDYCFGAVDVLERLQSIGI